MNKLPYCEAICRETHRGVTKESNCKNYARHTWLGKPVCKVHLNHYLWLSKKALDSWEIGGEKTRHEIISMAREARGGLDSPWEFWVMTPSELERFAALVAASERERIKEANAPEIEKINAHIKALENAVVAEREACAKVCDERDDEWGSFSAADCAAAIRARGEE